MPQFLISNFRTGFDQELEPWLLLDDAFVEVNNYLTQRGVVKPRRGIQGFAQGGRGDAPNEQSRMVSLTEDEAVSDTNQAFTHTLANVPVRPGSVTFSDNAAQTATDDGAGGFTGDFSSGTIDYFTGNVSATWTAAPTAPITVTYTHANGNPIVGIFNFVKADNTKELVVCSTNEFNRYNPSTNRFDIIPFVDTTPQKPTGNAENFFSATMYRDESFNPVMILVNGVAADGIYVYDGTEISLITQNTNYNNPPGYTLGSALHVYYYGGRLVFFRPVASSGKIFPQDILWSGIQDSSGTGFKFNTPGASSITIPSEWFITATTKLRNVIIFWTEEECWEFIALTTSDELDPFDVKQLGDANARGSQAPFSGVTWFGESAAVGALGIVGTDGRDSYREDNKIPFFTRDRMAGMSAASTLSPYSLVSSGTVFEDDQFWWLYPDINKVAQDLNTNVLAYNFVEESWAVYDLKLTRMGKFQQVDDIIWDNVNGLQNDSWAQWDTTEEIWDDFQDQRFSIFTLCGDKDGFIYSVDTSTDQCAEITGISQAAAAVVSTEPDTLRVGDKVFVTGVSGMTEVNGLSFTVTAVSGTQVTIGVNSTEFSAYTSGGTMCRYIPRELIMKPFNPFVSENKKCRLNRAIFFFDTDKTSMLLDLKCDRRQTAYRTDIPLDDGTNYGNAEKKWTAITINQVADFHTLRLHQEIGPANERLHAIILEAEPVGRLYR